MAGLKQKEVELLIMDDDVFFNNLLAKQLSKINELSQFKNKFKVSIHQYTDPFECLSKAKSHSNNGQHTIAFVDFYLGHGINGQHVIKLLTKQSRFIKIVLMSQSERAIGKPFTSNEEVPDYSRVIKRKYTPEICYLMLLQFCINH